MREPHPTEHDAWNALWGELVMRAIVFAVLASLLLTSAAFAGGARRHDAPRPATPSTAQPLSLTAQGSWKTTHEDAWQSAVEKAQENVAAALRRQYPGLIWSPALEEYVRLHVIKGEEHEETRTFEGIGPMRQLSLRLELGQRETRDLAHLARRDLALRRLFLVGKLLAALAAALTVLACLFRLDQSTKGYFTAWLRLGAVGALAAIGAGYWYFS